MSDYDLLGRDNTSVALVAREEGRPHGYPAPTAPAASVEVLIRSNDEPPGSARRVCVLVPGGASYYEYNPALDRTLVLMTRAYSPTGMTDVSRLLDAHSADVPFLRETEAPVIGLNKPATAELLEIGITGFTLFARMRRVTISANADMSDPLAVLLFDSSNYVARELPRFFKLSRRTGVLTTEPSVSELDTEAGSALALEDDATVLPLTIYLTVAHSGGTAWTPESTILEATFAAADGTGGSDGEFDPIPHDTHDLDLIV